MGLCYFGRQLTASSYRRGAFNVMALSDALKHPPHGRSCKGTPAFVNDCSFTSAFERRFNLCVRSRWNSAEKIPLIESKIGYKFKDKSLLELAFIHSSFIGGKHTLAKEDNERLEFLGDAVLELLVTDFLYSRFPRHSEEELSYLRSRLVDNRACLLYTKKVGLEPFLRVGKAEAVYQGKVREPSLLANLFEAVLGAIYLDGGIEESSSFFFGKFEEQILQIIENPRRNWKKELQDFCQKKYRENPEYEVKRLKGRGLKKTFLICVKLDGILLGEGEGRSKKMAEHQAAENAMVFSYIWGPHLAFSRKF